MFPYGGVCTCVCAYTGAEVWFLCAAPAWQMLGKSEGAALVQGRVCLPVVLLLHQLGPGSIHQRLSALQELTFGHTGGVIWWHNDILVA